MSRGYVNVVVPKPPHIVDVILLLLLLSVLFEKVSEWLN